MIQDIKSINLKQEEESNLRLPILALANSEPQDGARIVLACMQSPFGQKSLAKFYTPWEEGVSNH
jgi:hypothetical protein